MKKSILLRIKNIINDFYYLSIKSGVNPVKIFDREFCIAFRQFESLPISNIKVVVDVGAHEGLFSKRISKLFTLNNLIMIEPLTEYAQYLKKINLPQSSVYTLALSDIEGKGTFYISECLQASSLLLINPFVASQDNINNINEISTIETNIRRLDNLLSEINIDVIDFLKLDTQGAELSVLKGCGIKLRSVRLIQIEVLFEEYYKEAALFGELNQFLHSNGFLLHKLFDFSLAKDGHILYCDAWYINTRNFGPELTMNSSS